MKKLACFLLVLSMCLSMLVVYGQGVEYVRQDVAGRCTTESLCCTSRSNTSIVSLAKGNHEKWLDRIAYLPVYAQNFYDWLVENSTAQGALADPTKGTNFGGEYCHSVVNVRDTIQVACAYEEREERAASVASEAIYEKFHEITDYLGAVYDVFDRDHPEVFWLTGDGMYGYTGSYYYGYKNGTLTVMYEIELLFYLKAEGFDVRNEKYRTPEAVAKGITLREQLIDEILADCPTTNVRDQIFYLNKVLAERNGYNSIVGNGGSYKAKGDSWECISALAGRAGTNGPVCEGYARAFMVLCQRLGIPCVLVDGDAKTTPQETPKSHMWNYVQVDGNWYGVDVTWNDPYDRNNPTAAVSGYEHEKLVLLGKNSAVASGLTFKDSHPVLNRCRKTGLAYTNGPVLAADAYVVPKANKVITGTINSFGDAEQTLTLELYRGQEQNPLRSQTLTGKTISFRFEGLEEGDYRLLAKKEGHVSREYQVSTSDKVEMKMDMKLCPAGDITGDGKLNVMDVARVYSHARGAVQIGEDYQLTCADMNGDGKVNILDVARIYAKVKAK